MLAHDLDGSREPRHVDLAVPARWSCTRTVRVGAIPNGRDVMDSQILLLLLPIIAIQLALIVLAVRDLLRPERQVRGDSKLLWGLIIVFVNIIGPLLYFAVGRREA
jgi:hypothetical protein